MTPLEQKAIELVPCPRCGEQAGDPCRAVIGHHKVSLTVHGRRKGLLKRWYPKIHEAHLKKNLLTGSQHSVNVTPQHMNATEEKEQRHEDRDSNTDPA